MDDIESTLKFDVGPCIEAEYIMTSRCKGGKGQTDVIKRRIELIIEVQTEGWYFSAPYTSTFFLYLENFSSTPFTKY